MQEAVCNVPPMHGLSTIWRRRFAPVWGVFALVIGVAFLTRCALAARPDVWADVGGYGLARVLARGAWFDFAVAAYAGLPLLLWLVLMPDRLVRSRGHRVLLFAGFAATAYGLLLVALSEWIFWDEFAARFNFIAVDYLVYTHEVLGNIWQSYPVGRLLLALVPPSLAIGWACSRVSGRADAGPTSLALRATAAVPLLALAGFSYFAVASSQKAGGPDAVRELSGNGIHDFMAAFRANELDYEKFYSSLPANEAAARLRRMLTGAGEQWPLAPDSNVERVILDPRPERALNVVLVSVESLGAEFVGYHGNTRGLTPVLDSLAKESLVFTSVFATGNRTVRGLEALALSIPPTPGQSIVKRPGNDELFTLGSVFEDRGYATRFIYGGYGYFDNMNAFFSTNDYQVVDRTALAKEKIAYENIWGIADENLFDLALEEIDRIRGVPGAAARPFFAHVMTTSNHRPYTYPAGRIDIPSGTGRDGAVKYSDYALGHFMEAAKKKPWFEDTLFVLTADHGANARGGAQIPVEQYRIPVLFYSPKHIPPGRVDRLMSQIDIPPTILGQLHFSYHTKFFGRDIERTPPGEERAFVGNYQTLGYMKQGRLVTLAPQRRNKVVEMPGQAGPLGDPSHALSDAALQAEAIAWYQSAARTYKDKQYADGERNALRPTTAMLAAREAPQ